VATETFLPPVHTNKLTLVSRQMSKLMLTAL